MIFVRHAPCFSTNPEQQTWATFGPAVSQPQAVIAPDRGDTPSVKNSDSEYSEHVPTPGHGSIRGLAFECELSGRIGCSSVIYRHVGTTSSRSAVTSGSATCRNFYIKLSYTRLYRVFCGLPGPKNRAQATNLQRLSASRGRFFRTPKR
jgi:hypothetical protein